MFVSETLVGTRYHLVPGKLGSSFGGNTVKVDSPSSFSRMWTLIAQSSGAGGSCRPLVPGETPCADRNSHREMGRSHGLVGRGGQPGREAESPPALGAEGSERSDSWLPRLLMIHSG